MWFGHYSHIIFFPFFFPLVHFVSFQPHNLISINTSSYTLIPIFMKFCMRFLYSSYDMILLCHFFFQFSNSISFRHHNFMSIT